ncbi:MAG: protease modulator HflC [bacterium]
MKKMKRIVLLFLFGVLIILTCALLMFTVRETEYVIVTRFGKPVRIIEDSGLQFKLPGFFETVNRIDRRVNVFVTQPIQLLLGDKNPIILTCYVCWRVNNPALFFQSVAATESAQQKLGDMINSQLGIVLGDYRLNQIINTDQEQGKLVEIESRILQNANENARSKYGFEILQLGIRRLNYPSIVAKAVFNRMQSEREKEAKKYRAEGTEKAAGIEAETDREVTEILAKAYQESETIKGEGDREAIGIYAEAYGKDPELFDFLKSIELYETLLQGKSTLIISTQTDLFKYLTSPKGDQR